MTLKEHVKKHSTRLSRLTAQPLPFVISLGANDVWVILFICCLSLFLSKLLWAIPVYLMFKTNRRVVAIIKEKSRPEELEPIVALIQKNHLQSLTEAIESNPKILYTSYKKRPLAYWCKFHNNNKALLVITQMTKKYPKDSSEAKENKTIAA